MSTTDTLPRTRNGNPRLRCTDDVLSYWIERIEQVRPEREDFSYSSMIAEGDSLYHYGHHFELARILRDKRGRTRLVLLNGDSYEGSGGFGPSTASRQSDVRNAVARTNAAHVTIPFSALDGAGIDYETVTPIHVRDDRFTTEEHSSRKRPADPSKMKDPSGATKTEQAWRYNRETHESERYEYEAPLWVPDPNHTVGFQWGHGWTEGATLGDDGVWRWSVRRHWLGDCIFRARSTEGRTRRATADELAMEAASNAWDVEYQRLQSLSRQRHHYDRYGRTRRSEPINYRRLVREAWLQASAVEALDKHYEAQPPRARTLDGRVPFTVTRWATFLSSFDYQEPRPLYFLCELPYGAKPNTVDEAIEALKPPEVVAALARGLEVIRQGDLFAIPTKLSKRQIRRMAGKRKFTKRLRILGTNHSVTEGIVLKGGAVLGCGIMRHEPEGWRPPDHKQQKLGKSWHLLVRNTVPRTR